MAAASRQPGPRWTSGAARCLNLARNSHPSHGAARMSYSTIEYAIDAGVATIALNRPDKLNAFNETMHAELREALAAARTDAQVRCVLLTGRGRGFCAGQDLSDRATKPGGPAPDLGATLERNYNP